jgi:hypothetical protein
MPMGSDTTKGWLTITGISIDIYRRRRSRDGDCSATILRYGDSNAILDVGGGIALGPDYVAVSDATLHARQGVSAYWDILRPVD